MDEARPGFDGFHVLLSDGGQIHIYSHDLLVLHIFLYLVCLSAGSHRVPLDFCIISLG